MKTSARHLPGRILAAGVLASLALAGCSSSGGDQAAGGKTTLKVTAWKGSAAEPANLKELNAAFEKANPDIKVNFEYVPAGDTYLQKMQPSFLAGDAPDVLMASPQLTSLWAKSNYLKDLSGESYASRIDPNIKQYFTTGGKLLGAPLEVIGIGLYANMDLLKKAGVQKFPATQPEFEDALKKLKAAGIDPIALPNKDGWEAAQSLEAIAASGVRKPGSDWDQQFMAGKASFSDWASALEQLSELDTQGYLNWKKELGVDVWSQGTQNFIAGKNAFFLQGAWNVKQFKEKAKFDFALGPWPAGPAGSEPVALATPSLAWSINSQTQHSEAAQKYVDFFTKDANLKQFLQAETALNPFKDGQSPDIPQIQLMRTAYEDGRYVSLPYNTWLAGDKENDLKSVMQGWSEGSLSNSKALAELDKRLKPKS